MGVVERLCRGIRGRGIVQNMIRIQQLKMPVRHDRAAIEDKIRHVLGIPAGREFSFTIVRRSIDARRKPDVCYIYTVDVAIPGEEKVAKNKKSPDILLVRPERYRFPSPGSERLDVPPVIAGAGPAGLFCAYELAGHGYRPIVIERGRRVEDRVNDVRLFWERGTLDPSSNVQFGEGGAGAFSDGKLNTMVRDPKNIGRHVLETFSRFGAPAEILYDARPHIGTDRLVGVIANMRDEVIRLGGSFYYGTRLTGFRFAGARDGGRLAAAIVEDSNGRHPIDTKVVVLAIGHSARDTFEMLLGEGFAMEAKAFAVGLRVEHPQAMINERQYGKGEDIRLLPPASYKVSANFPGGRGVYSFCMCPGGYVVNASSEPGRLAVNGMSYSARDSANANSAIIVSVTPDDFPDAGALSGVAFQRALEERAYGLCGGKVPQQLYGDFKIGRVSTSFGAFESRVMGAADFAPLHELMGEEISRSFAAGMEAFGKRLRGFDRPDAILSGIESRTSSPVRILRNAECESSHAGVYPCGEGAGYAGGIMSAAMDGIRVAESVARRYRPIG